MRRSILINVFILSSLIAYEQIKFNNVSSLDKDDTVLYIGVENYIEISGINLRAGKPTFNVTHGEISNVEGNKYLLRVFSQKPDTLKFYQNGHLSLKEVFTVKAIPYPVARLANSNDTILSIAQIKINPFLSVVIPGCSYKHDFQIMSFNATTISANGDSILFEGAYGNQLTRELLVTISGLSAGDKILFEDIIVTCPDCRNRRLPNLTITIK